MYNYLVLVCTLIALLSGSVDAIKSHRNKKRFGKKHPALNVPKMPDIKTPSNSAPQPQSIKKTHTTADHALAKHASKKHKIQLKRRTRGRGLTLKVDKVTRKG